MKRLLIMLLGAVLAVGLIVQASGASSRGQKVLEFNTMVGVNGPFVGSSNPIRASTAVDYPGRSQRVGASSPPMEGWMWRYKDWCCSTGHRYLPR